MWGKRDRRRKRKGQRQGVDGRDKWVEAGQTKTGRYHQSEPGLQGKFCGLFPPFIKNDCGTADLEAVSGVSAKTY